MFSFTSLPLCIFCLHSLRLFLSRLSLPLQDLSLSLSSRLTLLAHFLCSIHILPLFISAYLSISLSLCLYLFLLSSLLLLPPILSFEPVFAFYAN